MNEDIGSEKKVAGNETATKSEKTVDGEPREVDEGAQDEEEDAQEESGILPRVLRNLVILAVVFLIGFLMQIREVRGLRQNQGDLSGQVERLQREVEVERLGTTLAGAALYATHGDNGLARQEAIRFFDGISFLRMQVDEDHAAVLLELADRRDNIVGALGTGESFGIYQLADVFARFQRTMSGREYTFTVPTGLPPERRQD